MLVLFCTKTSFFHYYLASLIRILLLMIVSFEIRKQTHKHTQHPKGMQLNAAYGYIDFCQTFARLSSQQRHIVWGGGGAT